MQVIANAHAVLYPGPIPEIINFSASSMHFLLQNLYYESLLQKMNN